MTDELIDTPFGPVRAAFDESPGARVLVLLAHGAGGSLATPQIATYATGLASRGVSVVRFNFPYAERGRKTPGSPKESTGAIRAVADVVRARSSRLVLGGKSYGGRMASHVAAEGYPCDGLVFFGYPLHAPATPDRLRNEHLGNVGSPMLFLQGTRDAFARLEHIQSTVQGLPSATLQLVEGGDHSFAVTGRKMSDVIDDLAAYTVAWISERVT